MSNERTFKIINQAKDADYCLAIRGGKLVVNFSNPGDPYQRWIKKDNAKKDQEGQPAFALVNEATNAAIRHDGTTGPLAVSLVPYNLVDRSEENSVLWTMSKDSDKDFRKIRKASNIPYHIASSGLQIDDGRRVEMRSDNQPAARWKFVQDSIDNDNYNDNDNGNGQAGAGSGQGGAGSGRGGAGS